MALDTFANDRLEIVDDKKDGNNKRRGKEVPVVMLPLVGHGAALLATPLGGGLLAKDEDVWHTDVRVDSDHIGLGMVTEVSEKIWMRRFTGNKTLKLNFALPAVPPSGGCALEVTNGDVVPQVVPLRLLEDAQMAKVVLKPASLGLRRGAQQHCA